MAERLPSNLPPGAAMWTHRLTRRRAIAAKVFPTNRMALAAWVRGDPWGMGVVVPTATGGEMHAELGSVIVARHDGWFDVVSAEKWEQQWKRSNP